MILPTLARRFVEGERSPELEAKEGRYQSRLSLSVEHGKLKNRITLRELGADAYLEALLFERRGNPELLRHGAR